MSALVLAFGLVTGAAGPADDLVVRASAPKTTIHRGESLVLEARLVNTSRSTAWWVVRPGDGSEAGWREPHVWYTGELYEGGAWRPIEKDLYARCGLFDYDWAKDALELKPGRSIELYWLPSVSSTLDLPNEGRVRIRVHYAWGRGERRAGKTATPVPPALGAQPAWEVASEPVEIRVRSDIRVHLAPRGGVGVAGKPVPVDRLMTLRVTGRDGGRRVDGISVDFDVRGAQPGHRPTLERTGPGTPGKLPTPLALVGGREPHYRGRWTYPVAETVEVRAVVSYRLPGGSYARATSDWIEVTFR